MVGVCHPVIQILTLFQTKKWYFSHQRFQTWPLRNYLVKLEHQQNDFLIRTFDHNSLQFLTHLELKGYMIRSCIPSHSSLENFCPIPDQNGQSLYPFSNLNSPKNSTLWDGTHLHGLYKGVPPGKLVK